LWWRRVTVGEWRREAANGGWGNEKHRSKGRKLELCLDEW